MNAGYHTQSTNHRPVVRASKQLPGVLRPAEWMPVLFLSLLMLVALLWTSPAAAESCAPLLNYSYPNLQSGEAQSLCQYQGKVVLVVNTASYCGNTGQYAGLEALYRDYKDQGLVVLGFPSNDFGGQEPGGNREIAKFCRLTYGVEFPMFAKSNVIGSKRSALYTELARRTGVAPRWNFHKYLIDRSGGRVFSFESSVKPDDKRLMLQLKKLLNEKPNPVRST